MLPRLLRNSSSAPIAIALFLLSAAANAGAIGGHWDPAFFLGDAQFFVPDPPSPCLNGSGFESVNQSGDPCQGVALQSVSSDVGDLSGNTAHLSFSGNFTGINQIYLVPSASPVVQGINMSSPVQLTCTDITTATTSFCDDGNWFLQFFSSPLQEPVGAYNEVQLLFARCSECGFEEITSSENVTFTPEPGTLGLILGALSAAWSVRRRKRGI
jgi:hypothetical protein